MMPNLYLHALKYVLLLIQGLDLILVLVSSQHIGKVTGRPETMCPRTNVLGPLVPKLIVPCDTMSLD